MRSLILTTLAAALRDAGRTEEAYEALERACELERQAFRDSRGRFSSASSGDARGARGAPPQRSPNGQESSARRGSRRVGAPRQRTRSPATHNYASRPSGIRSPACTIAVTWRASSSGSPMSGYPVGSASRYSTSITSRRSTTASVTPPVTRS